jgi:hypothetical protein
MANHSTDRKLRTAVTAALIQLDRGEDYKRSQREATAGRKSRVDRPRPFELVPRFMRRLTRLFDDA